MELPKHFTAQQVMDLIEEKLREEKQNLSDCKTKLQEAREKEREEIEKRSNQGFFSSLFSCGDLTPVDSVSLLTAQEIYFINQDISRLKEKQYALSKFPKDAKVKLSVSEVNYLMKSDS